MIRRLFPVFLLLGAMSVPSWAGMAEADAAYAKGDYKTALREYRLAAEQGDLASQFSLGVMYENGQGVPQFYGEAVKWYQLAADQGYFFAQYRLALMYANGRGVPQNYVQAHMWANLAASQGFEDARKERELLAEKMTPAQIDEAQRLAGAWHPQ